MVTTPYRFFSSLQKSEKKLTLDIKVTFRSPFAVILMTKFQGIRKGSGRVSRQCLGLGVVTTPVNSPFKKKILDAMELKRIGYV